MIKRFIERISSLLLPNENDDNHLTTEGKSNGFVAPRQRVLNKLKEQFLTEMAIETTTESLLYHTSFTVYIREEEYERLSPSFAQTVRDAINVFVREVCKVVKKYPDYQNHSRYWEMQLVAIPQDAEIDGINADKLQEEPIIIKSKLFADNEYDARCQDDEHCVVTLHTKDSSKQMPNAFNLAALKGLTELAKDKYRVEFNLGETLTDAPRSESERTNNRMNTYATLHIVDGDFILGERKYRVYNMSGDKLLVSGKNGSATRGVDEIHINDESVLSPTLEIVRDKKSGTFNVKVWGDVNVNEKTIVDKGVDIPLYNNSKIMINGDYQINFQIK